MSTYKTRVSGSDAAEQQDAESRLMCAAHGCPNRWSTESSKLCRWHSASPAIHWPTITREQQEAETERAQGNSNRQEPPPAIMLSRAEKTKILQTLRRGFPQRDPRAWIGRLRARHDAGERLSTFQMECLLSTSRARVVVEDEPLDIDKPKGKAAQTVAAYLESHPEGY